MQKQNEPKEASVLTKLKAMTVPLSIAAVVLLALSIYYFKFALPAQRALTPLRIENESASFRLVEMAQLLIALESSLRTANSPSAVPAQSCLQTLEKAQIESIMGSLQIMIESKIQDLIGQRDSGGFDSEDLKDAESCIKNCTCLTYSQLFEKITSPQLTHEETQIFAVVQSGSHNSEPESEQRCIAPAFNVCESGLFRLLLSQLQN